MNPTALHAAGFHPLVSVVPPDGEISPDSKLHPDSRGKVPGKLRKNGWVGYDFTDRSKAPTPEQIEKWGANVGILADNFPAVDIDVEDETLAKVVRKYCEDILGWAPTRSSRAPRMLVMYKCEEPFPKMALKLRYKDAEHAVEVLGHLRQYLIAGTHPSGAQYAWDVPLTDLTPSDLTRITQIDVERLFEVLTAALTPRGVVCERVGAASLDKPLPDQASLLAPSIEALQGAMRALPNDYDSRDTYIGILHAVKAAGGSANVEESLEAVQEWASRWTGGTNDPEQVERDFNSCKPPFQIGWPNIEREAYSRAPTVIDPPGLDAFEYSDEPPPPLILPPKGLTLVHLRELLATPDKEIPWIVDGWIPEGGLSLIAAKPKVGKSALLRDLAISVAQGRDFLGRKTRKGPVIYIHLEDSERLMRKELRKLGGTAEDILLFAGPAPKEAFKLLWESAEVLRPVLIIIDTAQRWLRIKKPDDYAEVTSAFDPYIQMARKLNVAPLFSHHSPKAEKYDVADNALGSIAFFGSVDIGFFLARDRDNRRYLTTRQREDQTRDVEGHLLEMDRETHRFEMGASKNITLLEDTEQKIIAFLHDHPGVVQSRIFTEVIGKGSTKRDALKRLVDTGRVDVAGKGRPGNPYTYSAPKVEEVVGFDFTDLEKKDAA